ncbi:hypothetical protein MRB53_001113 [Persea americana]|uniref:Uncharacterized protein n=1 Tax=Persea americana TaxID=3435 RepID=A0ACC2MR33_PERAE|nr:hypothetical protein MRB53_001113 [Persea americana]
MNHGIFSWAWPVLWKTLCGQAYGARKYHKLGIYLQRSWIVLFCISTLLSPIYMFTTPVLELMGQPKDMAAVAGSLSLRMLPVHFSYPFQFPLQRFFQCQQKNKVSAYSSAVGFVFHAFISWLLVYRLNLGIIGAAFSLNLPWWVVVVIQICYAVLGGCPLTWTGFSIEAFSGLWKFFKLSPASGVMVCMSINGWEMMISFGFLAATGVRVSNELGAGNGRAAKFATKGIWAGMIGGTAIQTLILAFVTIRCNWDEEGNKRRKNQNGRSLSSSFCILASSPEMNGTECYNLCPSNSSYCPPPVCFTLPPIPNPPHQQPSRDNSHVIIVIAFLVSTFILLSLCALAKHSSSRNTSTPTSAAPPTNNSTHQDHGPRQDPTHHTVDVESQRVVDTDVRSGGLEVSLIESITVCRYKRGDGLVEGTECSICLVEFRENEKLRFLPSCTHAFHPPCIDTWLRSNVNCPLCRRNIIPNP